MSTTHDWAKQLRDTAEFLLSRPDVEIGDIPMTRATFYSNKEGFLALVRATLPGKKDITEYYVNFFPKGVRGLEISANRDLVCHKVQDVKYECEPLLSPEEDAEMAAEAASAAAGATAVQS